MQAPPTLSTAQTNCQATATTSKSRQGESDGRVELMIEEYELVRVREEYKTGGLACFGTAGQKYLRGTNTTKRKVRLYPEEVKKLLALRGDKKPKLKARDAAWVEKGKEKEKKRLRSVEKGNDKDENGADEDLGGGED